MKYKIIFLMLLVSITATSQSRFSEKEFSINAFRAPSIGAEFRYQHLSFHAGYYLTAFGGVTNNFVKTGLTYWFLPVGKKENPSSFYAGASYLRGLDSDYKDKNGLGTEVGFRWMIWKGLNLRIGMITVAAESESLKLNPAGGISYSFFFDKEIDNMKSSDFKTPGLLLIIGAVALFIPYTILTITFEYPDILRQDTAIILSKFHDGGNNLILTWFVFAVTGLPLLPAYILLGQQLENKFPLIRVATTIGVIGLIVQMIGLLRWTFVVPVLADTFVNAMDEPTKAAAVVAFKTIHQYGGVILGEHLGQLFTIIWTVMISISFRKLNMFPRWVHWLAFTSSFIYLLAQAELFATVMPDFPVWDMAGFIGSTLWLIWLIIIGILFLKKSNDRVSE